MGAVRVDKQSPNLTIRTGVPDDYEAVLAIQKAAYGLKEAPLYGAGLPPLFETPESIADEVKHGITLVVGEIDGHVVASLRAMRLPDRTVHFCRLSVAPDRQGCGIGQKMTLALESLYPDAPAFILECGEKSDENMHIYTKLGYEKTGKTFQVENGPFCHEMRKIRRQS